MANTLKIKRGTKSGLPTLNVGELGFASDTNELYIGTASGNYLINQSGSSGDLVAHSDFRPSGRYLLPYLFVPTAQTLTLTNLKIYFIPILIPRNITLNYLGFYVTTAASGKQVYCGLYGSGTTNYMPYGNPLCGFVGLTTATGFKNNSTQFSQSLTAGRYWLAMTSDGTPAVRAYQPIPSLLEYGTTPAGSFYTMYSYSYRWATNGYEMPTMDDSILTLETAYVPAIWVRL